MYLGCRKVKVDGVYVMVPFLVSWEIRSSLRVMQVQRRSKFENSDITDI